MNPPNPRVSEHGPYDSRFQVDLSGLRALVTGSTKGIGRAIACRLANFGAEVAVNGRTGEATDSTIAALLVENPALALRAAPGDLANEAGASAVFAAAGPVDILVNNVGVYRSVNPFEITDTEWEEVFQVNLMTAVRAMRHFGPTMAAKSFGRIVNIGSEAGVAPPTELIHYAASKAALHAASRGFAQALAGTGVTVNSVIAGPTAHDYATAIRSEKAAAEGLTYEQFERRFFRQQRPTSLLGRYLDADEIATLVAFIVSRAADFTSGAAWRAEGGILTAIS